MFLCNISTLKRENLERSQRRGRKINLPYKATRVRIYSKLLQKPCRQEESGVNFFFNLKF